MENIYLWHCENLCNITLHVPYKQKLAIYLLISSNYSIGKFSFGNTYANALMTKLKLHKQIPKDN